jgi:hypothetical protein
MRLALERGCFLARGITEGRYGMEEVCKNFDDWMHFCFVKLAVLGVVCRGRLCRAATEYALQGRHCRFLCCAAHSLPAKPR